MPPKKPNPVILLALYGYSLDGKQSKFKPTMALCRNWPTKKQVKKLVLLHQKTHKSRAQNFAKEIYEQLDIPVDLMPIRLGNPWSFKDVYPALRTFGENFPFDRQLDHVFSLGTGTDTFKTCLTLLTVNGRMPVQLAKALPPTAKSKTPVEIIDPADIRHLIDIDDRLSDGIEVLSEGLDIRSESYKEELAGILRVALSSPEPILLHGETGTGKTRLASRIHNLRKRNGMLTGALVSINCAGLSGELLHSELFGHKRGAFTGASNDRKGKLLAAHKGMLYLDEIADLPAKTQVLLLKVIDEKTFCPLGGDQLLSSDFQLVCSSNRDLFQMVREDKFRADLFERIATWTFELPNLRERRDDLPALFDRILDQVGEGSDRKVDIDIRARKDFLAFALSPESLWLGNFRDLHAAIKRMVARANWQTIDKSVVAEEIAFLTKRWALLQPEDESKHDSVLLKRVLGSQAFKKLDQIDIATLGEAIRVCLASKNLADAGRKLFNVSRQLKATDNDTDRLRKMLKKHNLTFERIHKQA